MMRINDLVRLAPHVFRYMWGRKRSRLWSNGTYWTVRLWHGDDRSVPCDIIIMHRSDGTKIYVRGRSGYYSRLEVNYGD